MAVQYIYQPFHNMDAFLKIDPLSENLLYENTVTRMYGLQIGFGLVIRFNEHLENVTNIRIMFSFFNMLYSLQFTQFDVSSPVSW